MRTFIRGLGRKSNSLKAENSLGEGIYIMLKWIIEALLLSSTAPLTVEAMLEVLNEHEAASPEEIVAVLDELTEDYSARSCELVQVASGYLLQTKKEYAPWVGRLYASKPAKYSRALLETLAIIAYKQPVTRADIEDVRGVSVNSQIMKTLLERDWIRVAGYKNVPGKPAVYTTTKEFLNYFNLKGLNELPLLGEVYSL
jgi:segregation and condensation protein B